MDFSADTPKKIVQAGDPYADQVGSSVRAVAARLGLTPEDYEICFQSRVGPLEWIGPYTDEEIVRAARAGQSILLVPIAFVSEHPETLVELDIEYRHLAEREGAVGSRGSSPAALSSRAAVCVGRSRAARGGGC